MVEPFVHLASHPLRWQLATALGRSDLRVRELVQLVGEPQSLVSYHLRVLRDDGLVTARRSSLDARDTYYHLDLDRCADALARAGAALHPGLRMVPAPPEPRRLPPASVLFVCTGNGTRSPIAEALLRHHGGGRVRAASAGTSPRDRTAPYAVRVLRERYGIDVAGRRPRGIEGLADQRFDRVVTLCDRAREVLPGGTEPARTHWSIPEPDGYRDTVAAATEIDARVRHLLPTLTHDS
jgi:ArsR family transcriptional regulator, arsenate/arsenite/antimonite-responsive transcriptional repressor / arsenate reductase (thioredoxin)